MKTQPFPLPTCLLGQVYFPTNEAERIRTVFDLSADAPLPLVSHRTLRIYHDYLTAHLLFPFPALYAESRPPIRQLVRHIRVTGLQVLTGRAGQGLVCQVERLGMTKELPLIEIGVRDDHPNHPAIDDYAYWFLNWR